MIRPPDQHITRLIRHWNVRLRLGQTLLWLPRGVAAGLAAGVLVVLAARYRPLLLTEQALVIGPAAALAGGLSALAVVWAWPRPPLASARRYDLRFGLKERLSTALELTAGRLSAVPSEIARLQLQDTIEHARRVDARARLPLRLRWRDWAVMLGLLAAFLLLLGLPNPQAEVAAERQALEQAIESQVRDLRDLREAVVTDPNLSEQEREDILKTLDETAQTLEQPGISREEAVAALSEAEGRLQEVADREMSESAVPELREAGEALAQDERAREMGQAMREGDWQSAAQAARQMAMRLEYMSMQEREALAQQLEQAANAMQAVNPELAGQMREAAEALRRGDIERAQQAIRAMAEQMQQLDQQREQARQAVQGMVHQMQGGQQELAQGGRQQPTEGDAQSGVQGEQMAPSQGESEGGGQTGEGQGVGEGDQGGQASQPGQGQGQGFVQGRDPSGASLDPDEQPQQAGGRGAGQGEADFTQHLGSPGSPDQPVDTQNQPGLTGVREFEPMYAPFNIGGEGGHALNVPISPEDLRGVPWQLGRIVPEGLGESFVPYSQVFGDYADAASDALESGRIPLGLRGVIREYFTSLEP